MTFVSNYDTLNINVFFSRITNRLINIMSGVSMKTNLTISDIARLANVSKAIDVLHGYGYIHCLLDNDEAGRKAYYDLEIEFAGRIRDFSHNYYGYKDLNDYLCGKRQNLAVNPPPRTIVKPKKKGMGL